MAWDRFRGWDRLHPARERASLSRHCPVLGIIPGRGDDPLLLRIARVIGVRSPHLGEVTIPTHYKSGRDLTGWFRTLTRCPETRGQGRFAMGRGPRQNGSFRTVRSRRRGC